MQKAKDGYDKDIKKAWNRYASTMTDAKEDFKRERLACIVACLLLSGGNILLTSACVTTGFLVICYSYNDAVNDACTALYNDCDAAIEEYNDAVERICSWNWDGS